MTSEVHQFLFNYKSIDHRVSDGAETARFMQTLAGLLENPVSMRKSVGIRLYFVGSNLYEVDEWIVIAHLSVLIDPS